MSSKKIAAENTKLGLPTLQGTSKQIKWAEQIRYDKQAEINDIVEKYDKSLMIDDDLKSRTMQILKNVQYRIMQHSEAKWWIDNRYKHINIDAELTSDEKADIKMIINEAKTRRGLN